MPLKETSSPQKQESSEAMAYNYSLLVAKRLGITNPFERVTTEELEEIRNALSKGEPLSKIVIATRYGDEES